MITESSPVDHGLSEGGGGDHCRLPKMHAQRVNNIILYMYVPYTARDT